MTSLQAYICLSKNTDQAFTQCVCVPWHVRPLIHLKLNKTARDITDKVTENRQ